MRHRLTLTLAFAALALAACAGGADEPTLPVGPTGTAEAHGGAETSAGAPAEPAESDRRIEIRATDELRFVPSAVEVSAGETVTFVITNTGRTAHDFTLGDKAAQDQHERAMAQSGGKMAHGAGNTVEIPPGDTASITWRFDGPGEVLYGCHEPGHYPAGMVGTVRVS